MPQFLVSTRSLTPGAFTLEGPEGGHAARVLRVEPGDPIRLFDGKGRRWLGRVERVAGDSVAGTLLEESFDPPPALRLHLQPALLPRDRFEDLLTHCTELGASSFRPVITERTGVRSKGETKLERWEKVALAACKQCGRSRLPELHAPRPLAAALAALQGSAALIAWEGEAPAALPDLPASGDLHVFIGPEGGFTRDEIDQARAAGARPFSLGPLVLRSETAAAAAAALVLLGRRG